MKHSLEFYGPVDDSNRISIWGTAINSSIANIKGDEFPKQVADAVPILIYDHRISRIQKEINELRAMLEGIKSNINVPIEDVIELRDISLKQAKMEIKGFFEKRHGEVLDAGHIMDALKIDYDLIDKALKELAYEGKISEVN